MMRLGLALFAALVLLPVAIGRPGTAGAHPIGNFSVNRYTRLDFEVDGVRIRYVLDMAEVPAFRELQSIDRDRDGQPGTAEAAAYLAARLPALAAGLDVRGGGTRVALSPLPGADLSFPDGQGGLRTLRLVADFEGALPSGWQDGIEVTVRDKNYSGRLGWSEIVVRAGPGVALQAPLELARDLSDELTAFPPDLLKSPLDVREARFAIAAGDSVTAAPAVAPSGGPAGAAGRTPGGFARLVGRQDLTPAFVVLSLLAAMAWGAAHALGPGHGKTIVGAYLVGSRGTARHALALGLTVTATHTSSVVALGLVTLYASRYAVAEDLYLWLSVASGLLVLTMGAGLFWTRLRALRRHGPAAAFHRHAHHAGHPHGHEASHHQDHGHAAPAPGWRGLLMLGVSGGLLPCPTAIVVMLGAIALDRIPFGLALIGAFSFGLAAVLTAVGLALVYARQLLEAPPLRLRPLFTRAGPLFRLASAVPVISAIAILAAGLVLTGQALAAL